MDTKETKGKAERSCCSGFKDTPMDLKKMAEMMGNCCDRKGRSMDCSDMGKKMMNAMMEMCCGPKAGKGGQNFGNDKA
jgi:hypothetical protein